MMDTMLVSRVRILYIRSLLARSPELQSIKVPSLSCANLMVPQTKCSTSLTKSSYSTLLTKSSYVIRIKFKVKILFMLSGFSR